MPFVVRWPGRVRAGGTCHQMICHTDLMATLAAILEFPLPEGAGEDSISFLPLLKDPQRENPARTTLVTQSSGRVLTLRDGNWKLIPQLGSGGFSQPRKEKPVANGPKGQLYRLDLDVAETTNLWLDEKKQVAHMTRLLEQIKAGSNP